MSKPKILDAVNELDENGFYNKSTNLGDIRENPACLDATLENGIYSFTGGVSSPTDTEGTHKWSLKVYSCDDFTSVEQIAERLDFKLFKIDYTRNYNDSTWGGWVSTGTRVIFKASDGDGNSNTLYDDITLAIKSGKSCYLQYGNYPYPYLKSETTSHRFFGFEPNSTLQNPRIRGIIVNKDNTISHMGSTKLFDKYGDTMEGALTLASDPTEALHAATKQYVDTVGGNALPKSGGTMTGAITLPGAPTEALHAATKQYVDDNKYTHPPTHPASMITELESVISNLGYSKIVTGSYTGDGVKITRTSAGNDPETYQPLYKYTGGQTITLGFTPSIVVIFSTSTWSIVHVTQNETISVNVYKDGSSTSSPYYIARLLGAELIVGSINASTSSYYWYYDTNQDGYLYYWLAF